MCTDYFAKQVKDVLAPVCCWDMWNSCLDKDENGDPKKLILNFLKASISI